MPFRDSWLVVGVLLIFAGFGAEQPAIGIIGAVIVVLGAIARYWSRHLFDRVTFTRTPDERRAFIGEEVGVDFELTNKKPLPLPWYEWRFALGEALPVEGETLGAAETGCSKTRCGLPDCENTGLATHSSESTGKPLRGRANCDRAFTNRQRRSSSISW